jgi:hypothetical protein
MAFSILATIVRLPVMNYVDLSTIIDAYKLKRKRIKSNEPPNKPHKKKEHPALQLKFEM